MPSFSQVLSQLVTDAGVGGQSTVSYATAANLPLSGNTAGDLAIVLDTKAIYVWDGNEWDRIKAGVEEIPVFTAELDAVYSALASGTPFTLDATAYDPEGFDITYDYKTHPINQTSATITNNNDGTFTVAPSAVSGAFSLRMLASDGVNTSTRTSVIEVGLTQASYMLGGSLSVIGSDDSVFDGAYTPLPTVLSNNITTVELNKSQIDAGGEYISIQNIPNMTFNRTAGQMFPVFAVRFDANTSAAIGIVMRNSDNTYQYGIAQNGASMGFFPNGVSPIQYFSTALAFNTWYIFTPVSHWSSGSTAWRAKEVGGSYIDLTNGSSAGYTPPTTTLAGSITFFGADPSIPSAVQGTLSRAAMPHTFGGIALYPVDNFTADEGLAELETILFS